MKSKQSLEVVAAKDVEIGDTLSMDYGPEKLDNQLALDYGVYDNLHPQVKFRYIYSTSNGLLGWL